MARDLSNRVLRHGTLTGYTTFKCKCDLCAAAGAQWRAKRRKPKQPRLPVEPLYGLLHDGNRREMSHIFSRYLKNGIPLFRADYWCCRLGVHPYMVYGDAIWVDLWEVDNSVES
jgi:hypothetical protein